jgi:hypothetical protein
MQPQNSEIIAEMYGSPQWGAVLDLLGDHLATAQVAVLRSDITMEERHLRAAEYSHLERVIRAMWNEGRRMMEVDRRA